MYKRNPTLNVVVESPEFIPSYAHDGDAGLDCKPQIESPLILGPLETRLVPLGFRMKVEPGYVGLLMPKSGRGHKDGLVLGNMVGVIDSTYRGVVKASLHNRNPNEEIRINPGESVCQLVVMPVCSVDVQALSSLDGTQRGEGGFGSSGN